MLGKSGLSHETVPFISIRNYNFGDALNEPILGALSSSKLQFKHYLKCAALPGHPRLSAIGSIAFLWTGNAIVWGSGVLDERNTCPSGLEGMDFRCVRGPKTREHLMKKGYAVPETYCDPGVLAPYFFQSVLSSQKPFDIGIFPHNTDSPSWYRSMKFPEGKKVMFLSYQDPIDITIRRLSMCKRVASSSLHGIIVSEAMGIPAAWYRLTTMNDPFKFYDYYEGTGRLGAKCYDIRQKRPDEVDFFSMEPSPSGQFDVKGLLDTCPFQVSQDLKESIVNFYLSLGISLKQA